MTEARLTKFLIGIVAVQVIAIGYEVLGFGSDEETGRVRAQVESIQSERDSIDALVATHSELQQILRDTIELKESEADSLRARVAAVEQQRLADKITVRGLRKTSALQARLEATFPEMVGSAWGVTTIPLEPGDTLGLEYFVIPVWFTETFIIDHLNAESWLAQRDELLEVDSLRLLVSALQDSVVTLHAQNTLALQTGYDNATTTCTDLSTRYVAELRKPRFSLGSTVGLCLGAAGAGAVIATIVNR